MLKLVANTGITIAASTLLILCRPLPVASEGIVLRDVLEAVRDNCDQVQSIAMKSVTTRDYAPEGIEVWKTNERVALRREGLSEQEIERRVEGRWRGESGIQHTLYTFATDGERWRTSRTELDVPTKSEAASVAQTDIGEPDVVAAFNGSAKKVYDKRVRGGQQGPKPQNETPSANDKSGMYGYLQAVEQGLSLLSEEELQTPLVDGKFVILEEHTSTGTIELKSVTWKIIELDPQYGLPINVNVTSTLTRGTEAPVTKERFGLEATLDQKSGVVFPSQYTVRQSVIEVAPDEIARDPEARVEWTLNVMRWEPLVTVTTQIIDIDVNPTFPSDYFDIEFPPGTTVTNK